MPVLTGCEEREGDDINATGRKFFTTEIRPFDQRG
jgi:hypothetical protein